MCTGAKCQWDAYSYTCFNDTHLSCDKYEVGRCRVSSPLTVADGRWKAYCFLLCQL